MAMLASYLIGVQATAQERTSGRSKSNSVKESTHAEASFPAAGAIASPQWTNNFVIGFGSRKGAGQGGLGRHLAG